MSLLGCPGLEDSEVHKSSLGGFTAWISQGPVVVRTDSFLSLQGVLSLRKHYRLERKLTEALKGRDRGAYGQILNEQNLQA